MNPLGKAKRPKKEELKNSQEKASNSFYICGNTLKKIKKILKNFAKPLDKILSM